MLRVILAVVLLTLAACKGPPARLVAGRADTVVVNNRRPVQLPMRVLDAAGHHLDSSGVRYQWMAGAPVSVSTTGVVNCTESGDATVRASLGALVTHLIVLCRPVRDVRTIRMMNLVVGAPAQELPFEAVDANLAMLPDDDGLATPALAIVGANCVPGLGPNSYFCLAQHDASVIVYHPQQVDSAQKLSGTLVVWRQ